jgi:hypothetical protein
LPVTPRDELAESFCSRTRRGRLHERAAGLWDVRQFSFRRDSTRPGKQRQPARAVFYPVDARGEADSAAGVRPDRKNDGSGPTPVAEFSRPLSRSPASSGTPDTVLLGSAEAPQAAVKRLFLCAFTVIVAGGAVASIIALDTTRRVSARSQDEAVVGRPPPAQASAPAGSEYADNCIGIRAGQLPGPRIRIVPDYRSGGLD